MKQPLVSIIIPVYNVKEYLTECVDSVLNQSYENIEILLVDDGSTDGSSGICDEYAKTDERVKVIHQKNRGVSSARNNALDIAKGEYVLFVDSDDVALKDLVDQLVQLGADEFVGVVSCQFVKFQTNGQLPESGKLGKAMRWGRGAALKELFYGDKFSSGPHCKLIKRSVIGDARFDESLTIGEDFDFLCKLLLGDKEFQVLHTSQTLYGYRIREGSAMAGVYSMGDFSYLRLVQKCGERSLEKHPDIENAVAYRLFGVASFCAGKLRKGGSEHQTDLKECVDVLKKYGKFVLLDSHTSPKDRCLALAYMLNARFASWLRRVV